MGERADRVGGSDPDAIVEDIEQTRSELGSTLDAIQDRLDPERLTDQAVGAATEVTGQARDAAKEVAEFAIGEAKAAVRELTEQARAAVRGATVGKVEHMAANTRDTAQNVRADLMTTVKQNPIPAALAAIGISWLWTHRSGADSGQERRDRSSSDSDRGYGGDYAREYGYDGQRGYGGYAPGAVGWSASRPSGEAHDESGVRPLQAAGQAVGQVQDAAGDALGQAQDAAGQAVGHVQHAAGQVGRQTKGAFWQLLEANPLAVGALGAVIGGVAALMAPETEKENRLMGEARDRVLDRVQEAASDAVDKVQHVAAEVGDAAAAEAKSQGLTQTPQGAARA